MKVLNIGKIKDKENEYQVNCKHCDSKLEVVESDGKVYQGRYNEMHLRVECPVCQKEIYIDL